MIQTKGRLLVATVISGVLHVGLFMAGAGLDAQLLAGLKDIRRAGTLTVSIAPAAPLRDSVASPAPPVSQAARHAAVAGHAAHPHAHRVEEHSVASAGQRAADESSSNTHKPPSTDAATLKAAARARTARNAGTVVEAARASRSDARQQASRPAGGTAGSPRRSAARQSAAAGAAQDAAEHTYLGEFLAALSRYKHYPRAARLRGQEGKVVVALVLRRDGTIDDVHVKEPSRFPLLNRAALRTVAHLDRFKPFPADVHKAEWHLSVPFQYAISDQ